MITGVPAEARWIRPEPRRTLPSSLVGRIVRLAFPQCSVVNAQPLTEGLRNANFRLRLDSTPEFIVLVATCSRPASPKCCGMGSRRYGQTENQSDLPPPRRVCEYAIDQFVCVVLL